LNQTLTKISLFLGLIILIVSCDATKHVPKDKYLLTKNTIIIDSTVNKEFKVKSLLFQQPNKKILGFPLGLQVYNLANLHPDSTFQKWEHNKPNREKRMNDIYSKKQVDKIASNYIGFNKWIQKIGKKPTIIDEKILKKNIKYIDNYYSSFGWFNTESSYKIDTIKTKRASITYYIKKNRPYLIGTLGEELSSPIVDSLFQIIKDQSLIVTENQYSANDFNNERDRISQNFRNSGLFYFDQSYIEFEADSVKTDHKVNIIYKISDRTTRKNDTVREAHFKVHKISDVRIVTDYNYTNRNKTIIDSVFFNGYYLYSYEKLKFFPKAITDAMAISPGKIFKDSERSLTYRQISDLKIFKYPKISYIEDPKDSTGTDLIATILLTSLKKYSLGLDLDAFTSTIQQFGIGFKASYSIRNVFRRAEILEISAKGRVGSSKDAGNSSSKFFNNSDIGADMTLIFPRIIFPIKTDRFIPKYMSPSTSVTVGFTNQNNIGLDRQNINFIYNYRWNPKIKRSNYLDLLNIQFVKNLNPENYYNVYTSSYNILNDIAVDSEYEFENSESQQLIIPEETNSFIRLALGENNELDLSTEDQNEVLSITERQQRLTENNLIIAINYTWTRDTRENNKDNSFYRARWKVESAGLITNELANIFGVEKDTLGTYAINNVAFSNYIKAEAEFIKHWDLNYENTLAFRSFMGIAIPYGNSTSIPFTRSYFAGGGNDNRGWQAYSLGPGSSGGVLDFNEANFKITLNGEYRFKLFGNFYSALFIDAGNIWNVLDNITDPKRTFTSLKDLENIAVSSGFGLRYDFGFFVFRLDIGFKTYNPFYQKGNRWFTDYNFGNAVYNIGINYPF
jgi:outer membrane protein assembly factor BamA